MSIGVRCTNAGSASDPRVGFSEPGLGRLELERDRRGPQKGPKRIFKKAQNARVGFPEPGWAGLSLELV